MSEKKEHTEQDITTQDGGLDIHVSENKDKKHWHYKTDRDFAALGFGEVMMRLSPDENARIDKGNVFVKHAGGSELNVVSGISRLGLRSGLISKIPENSVGRYIRNQIRSYGVSDDYVVNDVSDAARLGIYYYESGAYPRKPKVIYDRKDSSFNFITPDELPEDLFGKTEVFHTSGVTLALGQNAQTMALELIKGFKETGTKISFDVNYRANLWSEEEARTMIKQILPLVDILFISEETSRRMMQKTGTLEEIQRSYYEEYGISVIASTQRIINSPRSHTFTSLLYAADTDTHYTDTPYENIDVIDRIGSGDAYVSGALYSLISGRGYEETVSIGNAMAAVKNTIHGDLITTDINEIETIVKDHHSIGYVSELSR